MKQDKIDKKFSHKKQKANFENGKKRARISLKQESRVKPFRQQ